MAEDNFDLAIVGAGFAGSLVAANVLALAPAGRPWRIALVERGAALGAGVAYGTPSAAHRLNVPAREMGAWADDADHFRRWLAARGQPDAGEAFLPRATYGAYVAEVLATAIAGAGTSECLWLREEAIGLLPDRAGFALKLASGRVIQAAAVVLAIGQFPPAPLRLSGAPVDGPWFVADPWSSEALAPLGANGEALLVGSGLTAVDLAIALIDEAGAGRVHLVSRHGRLPAPQRLGPAYAPWLDAASAPTRVLALFGRVRAEVEQAAASGIDWRAVVDALRPAVPALWARLPLVERRRFLRHLRSLWETHRNRLPPPTAARLAALQAEGRLVVHAGRLLALEPAEGGSGAIAAVRERSGDRRALPIARAINCTGPDTQYRRIAHPLVLDVLGTGLGRPDPLGLGLDVAPDGRLRDEDGLAERPIYTLGWPRHGQLWEATAVASLREQARDLATRLIDGRP